jgi:hypothetical protein
MAELPAQIAVILSGTGFFLCVFYLAAYRPVIFIGFFFILFSLVWRTASTMFIDLMGPSWSSQTVKYIGPGLATPLHVLAYFITLAPFLILLNRELIIGWFDGADTRRAARGTLTLSNLTLMLSLVFLGYLFLDLSRHGSIPLFAQIERFVYTAQYAGDAHRWLVKYGNFLTFWWGVMFAAERLRNQRIDIRYLVLLGVLLVYMFLTGNRFSAFYSFGSFFVIALSAVIATEMANKRTMVPFSWISHAFKLRDLIALGAIISLALIVITVGIYNNLVNVRGYQGAETLSQFSERLLVQPSELGWISTERVFDFGHWQPDRVFDFLFQAPLDPNKNTMPQYLMLETIGEPRTLEHISGGFQFAGGFPEIFFELFGPIYAWLFIFGAGYLSAALTALIVKGVIQGRYASTFFALYVLYGFYVMYIGGMLNFLATGTYWFKIAALAVALSIEWSSARFGLPLVPWALFRMPSLGWLLKRSESWVRRPSGGLQAASVALQLKLRAKSP